MQKETRVCFASGSTLEMIRGGQEDLIGGILGGYVRREVVELPGAVNPC